MKNFKELRIWQKGMEVVKDTYLLSNDLPSEEKFGIRSQMTRAAVSIPSNIAEGSSRQSDADYRRFLEMSLGSAFELETQLLIVEMLELVPNSHGEEIQQLLASLTEEQRMIHGMIRTINRDLGR